MRDVSCHAVAIGCVVIVAGLIVFVLRHLLTRPFYYDEGWRAYEIAQGARFLGHLPAAVGPLSFGYLATENVARVMRDAVTMVLENTSGGRLDWPGPPERAPESERSGHG